VGAGIGDIFAIASSSTGYEGQPAIRQWQQRQQQRHPNSLKGYEPAGNRGGN
jgi:hypothetical protein